MQHTEESRRHFIRKIGLAALAGPAIGRALAGTGRAAAPAMGRDAAAAAYGGAVPAGASAHPHRVSLAKGDVILFQGDSITDAKRKKTNLEANATSAFGTGYMLLAASALMYKYPDLGLQMYNRGVSGNKVFQLADRWQTDCLDLKPNVLSILVGVNDFWHTLVNGYTGTIQTYRDDYKALLDRTRKALPDVKLIIGEPYAIPGVKSVDEKWFPAFYDYQAAAKEIAAEFGAVFIPYQEVYNKALRSAPGGYWTEDGVHPSLAGAQLMADAWMETVEA
ncbi:SGNH/GDSL hydrolase family protein [Dinghuibacter silviterrae]|uniref:Lysophospholipase L1-like esterase n=1 Tax=Dinghuibacter silviterrae TaxID=1539049 RepID=A0A4R8DSX9_9BACT|nr:SGNH/GDSL hydrolase family protein [Dinghuibacter silviterrae]TDX01384.1 lysophospholipase L1-like esterase [Dinghuibacter silviterrae]